MCLLCFFVFLFIVVVTFVCHLMDIEVLDSIASTRVDDGLVGHVRDGEVVDGVVQQRLGWHWVLWQPGFQADWDWGGGD